MLRLLCLLLVLLLLNPVNGYELVKLDEDNTVTLRGEINSKSASKVINDLMHVKSNTINFYIISNGGSVSAGMEIIQAMKALEEAGKTVRCITNVGLSMGFVITTYCSERLVTESSLLMQHQVSYGVSGPMNNVNTYTNYIKSLSDEIDQYQAERLHKSLSEFKELVRDDWWITGKQAVENKVADKLVNVVCNFTPRTFVDTIDTFFGKVELVYSTCPLSKGPLKINFGENVSNENKLEIYNKYDLSNNYHNKVIKTF